MKHRTATIRNRYTENEREPAGTMYFLFGKFTWKYIAAITHGRPRPRNTFTEFEPVMFPMAESAVSEVFAATMLANVSGKDVPTATNVMAVIESSIASSQPSRVANCSTIAVHTPINNKATKKAAIPFK